MKFPVLSHLVGSSKFVCRLVLSLRKGVLIGAVSLASSLSAQTTTWTGAADNDWLNPANWTDGVPGSTTQAIFTDVDPENLDIELPDQLTEVGSLVFNDNLTGPITLEPAGNRAFRFQGGVSTVLEMQSGAPDVSIIMGTTGNDGQIQLPGGSNAVGTVINNSTSTLLLQGRISRGGSGTRPSFIFQGSGTIIHNSPGSVAASSSTMSTFTFDMDPGGSVLLTSGTTSTFGFWDDFEVTGGTLIVDVRVGSGETSNSSFTVENATLTGNGRIGTTNNTLAIDMMDGAIVDPGRVGEVGTLTFENNDVLFSAGSLLRLDLLNPTNHDILAFALTNAGDDSILPNLTLDTTDAGVTLNLNLLPGFSAAINDQFTILQGYDTLTGQFAGLTDGAVFEVDGWQFQINYGASDTILTVIPEPSVAVLILAAMGFGVLRFRTSAKRYLA